MNAQLKAILESKRRERQRLAALPFSEKVPLLERLRDRALALAAGAAYGPPGSRDERAWMLRERRDGRQPSGIGVRSKFNK